MLSWKTFGNIAICINLAPSSSTIVVTLMYITLSYVLLGIMVISPMNLHEPMQSYSSETEEVMSDDEEDLEENDE